MRRLLHIWKLWEQDKMKIWKPLMASKLYERRRPGTMINNSNWN
jgi:hypothetical protein